LLSLQTPSPTTSVPVVPSCCSITPSLRIAPRLHLPSFLALLRPRPTPTLFPYTTLFRSPTLGASKVHLQIYCHRSAALNSLFLRSEEHTSELQSRFDLVCRLLLEKKKIDVYIYAQGARVNTRVHPRPAGLVELRRSSIHP